MVQAAVVKAWGSPPIYDTIELPDPSESQTRIKVISAGLHNLVRSRAAGQHFSVANSSPPHIPGTDGVGTLVPSGELVYFNCFTAPTGSFAEEINVDKKDVFKLPDGADADVIAALANPVVSGWMGLTVRAGLVPGEKDFSVAIIGATGVSGRAAVQVAKGMGASKIVAIGKPGAKLETTKGLGATATIALGQAGRTDFAEAADVDIVLDYLWGEVSVSAQNGIINLRKNKSQRLTWIEIGALSGEEATVSAAMLRKANVAFLGCGPGSWTYAELYGQLPEMLRAMVRGKFTAEYKVESLKEVEDLWNQTDGARKVAKP